MDWHSVFWGFVIGGLTGYCFGRTCGYYKAKSETITDVMSEFREQSQSNEFFSLYVSTTKGDGGDDRDGMDDSWEPTDPSLRRDWN